MVEKFCLLTEKKTSIIPNLSSDNQSSLLENSTEEEYREYINSSSKGLKWQYQGSEFVFYEKGVKIFGYPTPDMEKIIIIFPMDYNRYCAPR